MASSPVARPDAIRRHNLGLILGHVHRDGALTRAELTARLGVSRSTIASLVSDLSDLGLVAESVPSGGEGVGRPSYVVGPHPDGPYVIAVDVDVTRIAAAAVDIGGEIQARRAVTNGRTPHSPEAAADVIVTVVRALDRVVARSDTALRIAVGVPGTVDLQGQVVGTAPNLGWRQANLGALLRDRLGPDLPIALGNDADLAVLAELRRGNARDVDNVVYLMGRTGVGAGIVANGVPMRGHDGRAGEVGHNVVVEAGPPCHCGKHGCLETMIGDAALLALAGREGEPNGDAVAAVFADARASDRRAVAAVRALAEPLGKAVGSLVNTLNPQRIILGGSLAGVLELAGPEVEAAMEAYVFDAGRTVELRTPQLGADSALLGAAELALTDLLADPIGQVRPSR